MHGLLPPSQQHERPVENSEGAFKEKLHQPEKNRAGLVQGPEHAVRKADPRRSARCEKAGGEEAEISTTDIHQLLQGFAWTSEDTT